MHTPTSSGSMTEAWETSFAISSRAHLALVLVTALFFIWGISNNLTDVLEQPFKKSFELSPLQAQLVQAAGFFGYFGSIQPFRN